MTEFAIPGMMPVSSPLYDTLPPRPVLSPYRLGNSLWGGISSIGPITRNGAPFPHPAVRVLLEFSSAAHGRRIQWVLDSDEGGDGSVTIVNAGTWAFQVPPQPLPLRQGNWDWSFKVVDSTGETHNPYTGTISVIA